LETDVFRRGRREREPTRLQQRVFSPINVKGFWGRKTNEIVYHLREGGEGGRKRNKQEEKNIYSTILKTERGKGEGAEGLHHRQIKEKKERGAIPPPSCCGALAFPTQSTKERKEKKISVEH